MRRGIILGLVSAGILAACAETPDAPTSPSIEAALSNVVPLEEIRDVQAVSIDRPPQPRAWDTSTVALEEAIAEKGGNAIVGFKAPGSERALLTGRRAAVPAASIRAALEFLARQGVTIVRYYPRMGAAHVRLDRDKVALLRESPFIDYIEPPQDYTIGAVRAPIKRYVPSSLSAQTTPWGVNLVKAPMVWPITTGAGAKIKIIDSGHDRGHDDLPLVPILNCTGPFGGCTDGPGNWHGTHVLGIMTARNNSIGVVGVAPGIANADVYVDGSCVASGPCNDSAIVNAIEATVPGSVLNLSLGGTVFSQAMADAITHAWNDNIVIVAIAGNRPSGTTPPSNYYPASFANVIGVSGVRSDKTFADTSPCQAGLGISAASNYGNYVDIAAPFWGLSTVGNNGYGDESDGYCGTSMAAPHVAGAAALLRAAHPTWTNAQIRDTLLAKAEDLGASGWDPYFGHGLLNVAAAFGYLGPLQVDIAGSWTPPMNTWCTWNAVVSGGFPPYSYKWYVDGNFVSPVSSYGGVTGTTDFLLRLEVTDALMNMNYKELLVDVQFMGSC